MFVHSTGTVADPLNTHRALIYKNLAGQRDDRTNRERIAAAERSAAQDVMANLAMTGADVDLGKLEMGQREQQMRDAFGLEKERFQFQKDSDLFGRKNQAESAFLEAQNAAAFLNDKIDRINSTTDPVLKQRGLSEIEDSFHPGMRRIVVRQNGRFMVNPAIEETYRVFYPPASFVDPSANPSAHAPPPAVGIPATAQAMEPNSGMGSLWDLVRKASSGGAVGLGMRGFNAWRNRDGAQQPESTNAPQRRFTPNHGLEILR